jgi:hypothetical protein
MVRVSPRLAVALGQAGLPALLVRLLHAPTALTALPLLQLLRSVYEHHPRPKVTVGGNTLMSACLQMETRRVFVGIISGGPRLARGCRTASLATIVLLVALLAIRCAVLKLSVAGLL